jgi:tetratricopeptide (TPR) repeat protein
VEALLPHAPHRAVEAAQAFLKANKGHPAASALLGRALAGCGRTAEAIAILSSAGAADHGSPDAWRLLGDLLGLEGDNEGADRAYLRQIATSVSDPHLRHAALSLTQNDLPTAETILRQHLKAKPTDVAAIRMMAELAARIGRYPDSIKLLRRAVELAPSFTAARHNLAIVLFRNNHVLEAIEMVDVLLADDADNPSLHNLAGAISMKCGLTERAVGHFEKALASAGDQAKIWMSYGHALKTLGRRTDGVAAYRRAIELEATLGEAWWSLANLKTFRFADGEIEAMEAVLEQSALDDEGRLHIAFALGKAREDQEKPAEAMAAYGIGNAIRRGQLDYRAQDVSRQVDARCDFYTSRYFNEHTGQGCDARDPVFVLGMPRSGSTLVEQILASHPDVEGTQELPDIHILASRIAGPDPTNFAVKMRALDGEQLRALGEEYIERTRIHRSTKRPLFIDKMPNNWMHVGLILSVLPNASIIDTRRHPLACCFSNYKQHFAKGQAFSYDLKDLGQYYSDYVRLMAHFDAARPGKVHRVIYEDMVANTETEVRRLLAHIGLPYDERCLKFHENARSVRTASSEQVRQPIFRDGLDQWTKFDPWLGPLKTALGPVLDTYPIVPTDWYRRQSVVAE